MGAQQDSSNTLKFWPVCSIVSLILMIFVLLSFTLESTLARMGGGIQSVHVHGATGKEYSGLKEQNPLEMLPHV